MKVKVEYLERSELGIRNFQNVSQKNNSHWYANHAEPFQTGLIVD